MCQIEKEPNKNLGAKPMQKEPKMQNTGSWKSQLATLNKTYLFLWGQPIVPALGCYADVFCRHQGCQIAAAFHQPNVDFTGLPGVLKFRKQIQTQKEQNCTNEKRAKKYAQCAWYRGSMNPDVIFIMYWPFLVTDTLTTMRLSKCSLHIMLPWDVAQKRRRVQASNQALPPQTGFICSGKGTVA